MVTLAQASMFRNFLGAEIDLIDNRIENRDPATAGKLIRMRISRQTRGTYLLLLLYVFLSEIL